MALGFGILLLLLCAGLVVPLVGKWWWFPVLASQHGGAIDDQFVFSMILCALIFIPAQMGLGYAIFRYRDRGQTAHYSHGNNKLEALWIVATAIFFLGMNLMGQRLWAQIQFRSAEPGALRIEVTGKQFAWNMRYAGPDGKFGRLDLRQISDASGNPLGLDSQDPAGRDDVVSPTMMLPVNRPIELILRSQDVTHSFFVRELRVKQDAVPGMLIRVHFTPTLVGKYELACAELCGLGHYKMRSFVEIVPEQDFEKWLKSQATGQ